MLELLRDGQGVESWAPTGDITRVFFGGDDILVAIRPDDEEVRRRRRHRLGAVTNRRALQVLLSMPRGVAVPVSFLQERDLRVLHSLPNSVAEISEIDVRVVLAPALRLLSVGVVAATWKQGLRFASPYAAYCERYVVLERGLRGADATLAILEARYYGLGLAECRDGHLEWLVSPASFPADRFSASSWLMAERLTAALRVAPH